MPDQSGGQTNDQHESVGRCQIADAKKESGGERNDMSRVSCFTRTRTLNLFKRESTGQSSA